MDAGRRGADRPGARRRPEECPQRVRSACRPVIGKPPPFALSYSGNLLGDKPMDLQDRLTEDMKAAMKSGQKDRLQVIRMMLSDVKSRDLMPNKPSSEQVV